MGAVQDLYNDINSYLRLTARVALKTGNDINVGENFTLTFTGSNLGPPNIVFRNVRIHVRGAMFATPVSGSILDAYLPNRDVFPGQSSSLDVVFRADSKWNWDLFSNRPEDVAIAWIDGDVDPGKFFHVWNSITIYEQIEAT